MIDVNETRTAFGEYGGGCACDDCTSVEGKVYAALDALERLQSNNVILVDALTRVLPVLEYDEVQDMEDMPGETEHIARSALSKVTE